MTIYQIILKKNVRSERSDRSDCNSNSESENMTREEIDQEIEKAATETTDSVRYTCRICKIDQYKSEKEHHKKSCSGIIDR